MKKLSIILFIVLLLAAAAGGLPYWFGMQAESAYEAMIAEMTANGDITVTNKNFQRGWLESTADTTFTITGTPVTVTSLDRIQHGPLPLDEPLELTPVLARVKSQMSIGLPGGVLKLPPISGRTTFYLAGNSQSRIEMAGAKTATADGAAIEWKGLTGTIDTSADFKSSKGELSGPALIITAKDGVTSFNRITIGFDQQKSPSGFDIGTANFGVDKLVIDSAKLNAGIDGLRVASTTQEAGGNLNSTLNFNFREVRAGADKQGPGQMTVQVRKLDVATLVKFRKQMRDLKKQNMPPEQANMMMLGKTLELLGELAKKAPEVEITKMSFKTADGEVTGKAKFVLDGSQLDVAGNPMLMLKALSGEGEVKLPDSLIAMLAGSDVRRDLDNLKASGKLTEAEIAKLTPKRVAMITQQAIKELPQYKDSVVSRLKLVPDGPNYKIVASLKSGQLLVNDQPLQMQ